MNENETTYSYLANKASLYMPPHPPLAFASIELERLGFAYGILLAARIISYVCAVLVLLVVLLALGLVATRWDVFAHALFVIVLINLLLALLSMQLKAVGDEIADKAVTAYVQAFARVQ